MKKRILNQVLFGTVLMGSLLGTSCSNNGDVKYTAEESRNTRIASAMNLMNSGSKSTKKNAIDLGGNLAVKGMDNVLPSLEVMVDNNFKVEGKKTEGKVNGFDSKYQFKEEIKFTNSDGKDKTLTMYYNDVRSVDDSVKYDENIEGEILLTETFKLYFSSVAKTTASDKNFSDARTLSIYLDATKTFSVNVTEETNANDKGFKHKFAYSLKVAGVDTVKFDINLDYTAKDSLEFSFLGINYNMKKYEKSGSTYLEIVASTTNSDKNAKFVFKKTVNGDDVNYGLDVDINL